MSWRRRFLIAVAMVWAIALAASYAVRFGRPRLPPAVSSPREILEVAARRGFQALPERVTVGYRDWRPSEDVMPRALPVLLPVLLLHGSPGNADDFATLGPALGRGQWTIAPDLPGFGASAHDVPDYSFRAHAAYLVELLDRLGIERVHVVGFSMSGGVLIELWKLAPQRIESGVMMSAVGVQELELLGSYHVNRLLHGIQLAAIRGVRDLVPHFGSFDGFPLDVSYARNFFDSDQRPLRGLLETFEPPMLIVHGEHDPLVPKEAALEHHRIVPQSELVLLDSSHFYVFGDGERIAPRIEDFFERVEAGRATSRRDAIPERVVAAGRPYAPPRLAPWRGPAIPAVMMLIALATLISEDLTCIGAGLLVAQGRLELGPAMAACYVGIVAGDLLLFWAGRSLGRRVVHRRPFRWWISERAIDDSSAWLRKRGGWVILATRVLPGTRLPTNIAAGLLHTNSWKFLGYFALAGAFWVPLIVGASARLGAGLVGQMDLLRGRFLLIVLGLGVVMYLVRHLVVPLLSWRGRRRLVGRWRYLTRWEFWPSWAIYPPVVLSILGFGLRHRSLALFTTVNPVMPLGGFVGESKAETYAQMPAAFVPAWRSLVEGPPATRTAALELFLVEEGLGYPVVLKPDSGQRGQGVAVVRSRDEAFSYFEHHGGKRIAQRYVEGREFGLFWARGPEDEHGEVFSVTAKVPAELLGDGVRTLEQLILADGRAVAIWEVYLRENPDAVVRVPTVGERVRVSEIGAHARGTIFLDACHLATPELVAAVGRFADGLPGFDFGRLDVRVESEETLRAGGPFVVLEVNGVTSEATHMYDPRYSWSDAVRILRDQWRRAFEIGAQRRRQGARPASAVDLWRAWRAFQRGVAAR